MNSMTAIMAWWPHVSVKARVICFLSEAPWEILKTFWTAPVCRMTFKPTEFSHSGKISLSKEKGTPVCYWYLTLKVLSFTPIQNALSSSIIGAKNVFSDLGSLLISSTIPATIMFSHLNRCSLGRFKKTK